ncbi:MAG: hypothetical protein MUC50_15590 [Myxococcota bacterium]|jgi:lipid-A-disaccharide synthase|nr:hypothetical protein [Myxococcota bacterium]
MNLFVSALEPSADHAAARVVQELVARGPLCSFGFGGPALARAGVELLEDATKSSAMGFGDVLSGLGRVARLWTAAREATGARQPDVALLLDSSDFHLPLARVLRASGIRVVQYIGPQIYAWRRGRIGLVARRVHALASILPFEPALYEGTGLRVEYVGHPLLDEPLPRSREDVRAELGLNAHEPFVALFPGSRPHELRRHVPVLEETARLLLCRGVKTRLVPPGSPLRAQDALCAADAAIAASGTVTLEAALCGCPTVVMYKLDRISAAVARHALDVPYIALPSWIAGRTVMPELVQEQATGNLLCSAVSKLLVPQVAQAMRKELSQLRAALGPSGTASRVANLVEATHRANAHGRSRDHQ